MKPVIVSIERALAEGTTPEQLILVAEWHEHRAAVMERAIKKSRGGVAKAFGDRVTDADRWRHDDTAKDVRRAADRLRSAARLVAA